MHKFILGLIMAVFMVSPASAWDLSGDFLSNSTGEVIDISGFYAEGPAAHMQVTLWTNATSNLTGAHNATLYGSPFGADGYAAVNCTVPGGAVGVLVGDIDNASAPSVAGFSGWAFDQIKIVNQSPEAVVYTINYIVTGW